MPLDEHDRHDLDAMAREITVATRLVIVCNPNNPTSTALPLDAITAFVERVPPEVCVILDEAYCEFNLLDDPDASVDLLERHPNLVLLRTFSKAYGLAALRVGYALCGAEAFVRAVHQVRQPFVVNGVATAAAIEALQHLDAVDRPRRAARSPRASRSTRACARWGSSPPSRRPTSAGSTCPTGVEEDAVVAGLRERGVLVRAGRALGRENALRVTYGTTEQNQRFLAALGELVS